MRKKFKNIFIIIFFLLAITILITSIMEDKERSALIKSGELCIGCEQDETIMDFEIEDIDIIINLSGILGDG